MDPRGRSFVVWMHHASRVTAVACFDARDLADAYAAYCNRRRGLARWFEVRSHRVP